MRALRTDLKVDYSFSQSSEDDRSLAEALDIIESERACGSSRVHVIDGRAMRQTVSPDDDLAMIEAMDSIIDGMAAKGGKRKGEAEEEGEKKDEGDMDEIRDHHRAAVRRLRIPEGPIMDTCQLLVQPDAPAVELGYRDERGAYARMEDEPMIYLSESSSSGGADTEGEEEIRVLYATDGYPVVCSLHLLLGQALLRDIYVVAYSHVNEPRSAAASRRGAPLRATFCLLANTGCERRRQRTRPVFVCSFSGDAAEKTREALREGLPLDAQDVIAAMDEERSFALHEDIIVALGVICSAAHNADKKLSHNYIAATLPSPRRTLAGLMLQHEVRTVAAFRRKYNASFSCPFWFVSKFGPTETSLVAVLRYYLLGSDQDDGVAGSFDLQGVKDLSATFPDPAPNKTGLCPTRLNTFAEFSRFWCGSELAGPRAEREFRAYLATRVASDLRYVRSLDSLIEKYRHALRLPAKDFVRFVYLAYHEGYNRVAVEDHLEEALQNHGEATTSVMRAQSEFFRGLREMCNMREFFARNVKVTVKRLPVRVAEKHALLRSYGELPRSGFLGFCRSSYDVSLRINGLYAGALCRLGTQLADAMSRAAPSCCGDDANSGGSGDTTIIFQGSDDSGEDEDSVKVLGAHMPPPTQHQQRPRPGKRDVDGRRLGSAPGHEPDTRAPLSRLTTLAHSDQRVRGIMPVSMLLYSLDDDVGNGSSRTSQHHQRSDALDRPVPVYRVAMPGGGQAFAAVARDSWDRNVTGDVFSDFSPPASPPEEAYRRHRRNIDPAESISGCGGGCGAEDERDGDDDVDAEITAAAAVDAEWTRALLVRAWGASQTSRTAAAAVGVSQMYLNRNEVLSESLAVGNLLLDVDITLKRAPDGDADVAGGRIGGGGGGGRGGGGGGGVGGCGSGPSMLTLHKAMRSVREALVSLWSLLFVDADVDPDTYPVYFYKTQCPETREDGCDNSTGGRLCGADSYGLGVDDVVWGEDECGGGAASHGGVSGDDSQNEYAEDDNWWGEEEGVAGVGGGVVRRNAGGLDDEEDMDVVESSYQSERVRGVGEADSSRALVEELISAAATRRCTCERKIGFRVCVPIPKPYALAGLAAAKAIACLAQQAIVLQEKFVEALDRFVADYEFVDSGVYSTGRSIRLPFFAKVDQRGLMVGRLLPFLVFPPVCQDRLAFVAQHADPNNFHSGAFRRDNPAPTLIITSVTVLRDVLSRDVAETGERPHRRNTSAKLIDALAAIGVAAQHQQQEEEGGRDWSEIDAKEVLDAIALPALRGYLEEHFPRHAPEYRNARVDCIRVSASRICAALRRPGAGSGYRSTFTCLRYQHRGPSLQTVIASVVVAVNSQGLPYVALQTRCFATKCGSNALQTQFTVTLGAKDV